MCPNRNRDHNRKPLQLCPMRNRETKQEKRQEKREPFSFPAERKFEHRAVVVNKQKVFKELSSNQSLLLLAWQNECTGWTCCFWKTSLPFSIVSTWSTQSVSSFLSCLLLFSLFFVSLSDSCFSSCFAWRSHCGLFTLSSALSSIFIVSLHDVLIVTFSSSFLPCFLSAVSLFFFVSRRLGSYLLGQTLGKGSYGKVKVGLDPNTGELVAIKLLNLQSPGISQSTLPKILQEVRAKGRSSFCSCNSLFSFSLLPCCSSVSLVSTPDPRHARCATPQCNSVSWIAWRSALHEEEWYCDQGYCSRNGIWHVLFGFCVFFSSLLMPLPSFPSSPFFVDLFASFVDHPVVAPAGELFDFLKFTGSFEEKVARSYFHQLMDGLMTSSLSFCSLFASLLLFSLFSSLLILSCFSHVHQWVNAESQSHRQTSNVPFSVISFSLTVSITSLPFCFSPLFLLQRLTLVIIVASFIVIWKQRIYFFLRPIRFVLSVLFVLSFSFYIPSFRCLHSQLKIADFGMAGFVSDAYADMLKTWAVCSEGYRGQGVFVEVLASESKLAVVFACFRLFLCVYALHRHSSMFLFCVFLVLTAPELDRRVSRWHACPLLPLLRFPSSLLFSCFCFLFRLILLTSSSSSSSSS